MKVYKTKEYRIMSVTSGKLLTANEDQLITVEAADEQKAQNWKFFPEENGCYRIVSTKSKKVVEHYCWRNSEWCMGSSVGNSQCR